MKKFTKSDFLDFIQSSKTPVTKRDIANAFHIKGGEPRIRLKKMLKELEAEGAIVKQPGGAYAVPEGLPAATVVEIIDIDIDGDVLARPLDWDAAKSAPPRIEMAPEKKGHPALTPGDRVLAQLTRVGADHYEGRTIRRLDSDQGRVLGVLKVTRGGAVLVPAEKKAKYDFEVPQRDIGAAKDGDLVVGEIQSARGMARKKVRIIDVLGRRDDPKAISLVSLHEAGLRETFPEKVESQTKGMTVPPVAGREDLRAIPLVTIDGADARDFDDAVFAEKTDEGFHLIVAIADVAYYVRHGTALDDEAQKRGNSTYFPDRVVPMLPEALSNDLCSLRPDEDRACLAVHMWIDSAGELKKYKFVRGLIRSHARLTYEQVQALHSPLSLEGEGRGEGGDKAVTPPHPNPLPKGRGDLREIIAPLYDAYAILDAARVKRGALDLDLPERQIIIDAKGNMTSVRKRERLDSHKLIEEFMVLANVAAAKALEARKAPCVYRIHDRPSSDKLDSAREFLDSFGLALPKGQTINPAQINYILHKAKQMEYSHLISTVILRTQSQAIYSTENIGHFGLALQRYAHFTSPIRRYADLLVHRSLISAYGLGGGGIDQGEIARLEGICQHITQTERNSMEAERNAIDRFTAAFLSEQIGATFSGKINGVTRFGLFVTLDESGADGLVPMRSLPNDFYIHEEQAHALIGRRSGRVFRLGASVTVRLKEADGFTGSTLLELVGHEDGADLVGIPLKTQNLRKSYPRKSGKPPHKGRGQNKRGDKPGKPAKKGKFRRR